MKKFLLAGAAVAVLSMFAIGGAKAAPVVDVGIDLISVSQWCSADKVTQSAASGGGRHRFAEELVRVEHGGEPGTTN